jgi:hypothetical protein
VLLLDERRAAALEGICEAVVPGSAPTGPVTYLDALVSSLAAPMREAVLGAIDEVSAAPDLAGVQHTPGFQLLRALAIEAYYSNYAQPGYRGPTAWDAIDFNSDQARRLKLDFSYLPGWQHG